MVGGIEVGVVPVVGGIEVRAVPVVGGIEVGAAPMVEGGSIEVGWPPPGSQPQSRAGPCSQEDGRAEGGIINNDGLVHRGQGWAQSPHLHSCRVDSHAEAATKLQMGAEVRKGRGSWKRGAG